MRSLKLSRLSAVAVAAGLALPLLGDEVPSRQTDLNRDTPSLSASPTAKFGPVERANKLIGMDVKNNQQEDIGDVNNLIVDMDNGRLVAVIVSSGGFLGLGDTLSAVPPQAFRWNIEKDALLLDVSKDTLKGHPYFKETQWPQFNDPNYVTSIYRAYRVDPYFNVPASTSTSATTPDTSTTTTRGSQHIGYALRANKLIGMDVKNNQREDIGDVNNLVVDLTHGRVVAVVVSSGGFLGIGDTLSAVPPQAFRLSSERDTLLLNVNKDTLAGYPQFKESQWPQFEDSTYVASLYRAYNIKPYWEAEAVGAGGGGQSVTSTVRGASTSDTEMTTRIRQALDKETTLSSEARNVQVTTSNGETTLRGTVNSEQEKSRVLEAAKQAAPDHKIIDQLQVKEADAPDR